MSELAVPAALDLLERQLRELDDIENLALPLRALQFRGLSKTDLLVHVERIRAHNDATSADPTLEENSLTALDLIHGRRPGLGLQWDAPHMAASLLGRLLNETLVNEAIPLALEPIDLLPPRPEAPTDDVRSVLATGTLSAVRNQSRLPMRADLVRVPKSAFTSRPAALVALPDRIALESLTREVDQVLPKLLPPTVIWPRTRSQPPNPQAAAQAALSWGSPYIVKADISAFYEHVNHSLLGTFLSTRFDVPVGVARAIESMLSTVMGAPSGLPQGPGFSDVLASSFLCGLDRDLYERGVRFVRYADDYFVATSSVGDGRRIVQDMEERLRDIGLALNSRKTSVMRRDTFERGLQRPSPAVEALKERLTELRLESLRQLDDAAALGEALEESGVDEEVLWDLLYHHTVTLDEVLDEVKDNLAPSLLQAYQIYLGQIAAQLREEGGQADIHAMESLAREALAFLSLGGPLIDDLDLDRVQAWFPSLMPFISRYLIARSPSSPVAVARYIERHVREATHIDWIDAWTCYTAGRAGIAGEQTVMSSLRGMLVDQNAGPLSQWEALRALAVAGVVGEAEWRDLFQSASAPLQSEMFVVASGEWESFPWMKHYLRDMPDPAMSRAAAMLESGGERGGDA
jgi:hypothetical protein